MTNELTTLGESFRTRALDAEKLLDSTLEFIQSKGLYNEYMRFKQNKVKP